MRQSDTPPLQLAGDALDVVHRQVAREGGDVRWFRDAAPGYIERCDPQSPVEPVMAVALAGAAATGRRIHIRPQHPVGHYTLDFAVTRTGAPTGRRQLAVEVDGAAWHTDAAYDARRDRELEQAGWDVERFDAGALMAAVYVEDREYDRQLRHGPDVPPLPAVSLLDLVRGRLGIPIGHFTPEPADLAALPTNPFSDVAALAAILPQDLENDSGHTGTSRRRAEVSQSGQC